MAVLELSKSELLAPGITGELPHTGQETGQQLSSTPEQIANMMAGAETASLGAAMLAKTPGAPTNRFNALAGTINELYHDDEVRIAAAGAGRLAANVAVTVADIFPGVGDAVSWAADAAKLTDTPLNLTPDVSNSVAWGTELLEPMTGGMLPSHAVETFLQAKHDLPYMRAGWHKATDIMRKNMAAPAST